MKKHHRSACILALALGALPAAHAELLVYEPFYYPVGVLTGQNGGTGFASGWVASTGVNQQGSVWNEATSVLFDGSTLNWNGALNNNFPKSPVVGARYAGATPSVSSDLAISRTLASSAGAMADANGVLWMSGVFHFENRNLGAGITMGLGDGYIANRGRAFQAAATTDFIGVNGSTSASAANFRLNAMVTEGGWTAGQFAFTAGPVALPTPATTDLIVIMKFTFRGPGLADDVEAAFFTEDTLLAEITEANFNSSPSKVTASYAAGIDENGLTVLSVAQGRFNNAMDEIRIGKTFASVVNFPAPGAVDVAASAVKASPTALPADGTSTATVTVTLMDALGVPVPGKDVTLAKAEGPAGAIIDSPTTVTTGGNGQAAFTVRSSGPGTAVFAATCAPDLEITQTASVTFVSSADADESTVVAEPIYVDANGSSTSTVTVTLKSAEGVPVAGKNVTLTGNPATAVITPVAPTSDANGVATFTVSSATPGTVVFTATDVTDNNLAITETASVNFVGPVNAGLSTVVASPAAVVANGTATSTITVSLKDANGFPTAGKEVTLAAGTENPVIVPESAMTNASGVATFTVSSGTIGTEVFTATAGSVTITQTASVEFLNPLTPFAVNVNFNAFTGGNFTPGFKEVESELFGPAGGLGTRWNQFSANSSSGMLLNPAGVGTSVAFTTDFSEGRYDGTGAIPMLRSTLTDFAKGSARTFTLTGLPPGALYDIWLTAFRNQPSATERIYGRWTANNPTTSPTVQFIDNRDGQNGASFVEGYNYIVFESVKADENGRISFAAKGMMPEDGATEQHRLGLSGFQIVPVGPALITSFGIPGWPGVINQATKTIALTVPAGTNLATLAPAFTLSSGTCNQTSGTPPSPTFAAQNPATYTVTDNSTTPPTSHSYTVTVTVNPAVGTLVIDLGTSPAGTEIKGGAFIGSGLPNLPLPTLPAGSILRSITVNAKLEATDNENYAYDLSVLLDPTPATPGEDFAVGIIPSTATVDFGETLTLNWAGGAGDGGPGTSLVDTKTDADWTAAGPIDLATTGLFLGNAFGAAPAGGTWSGTITLTYDTEATESAYETWAGGAAFDADKNGDGVDNGLAFLLGADNPDADALALLPEVSENAGGLVLTFSLLNQTNRGPALASVQWSNDLGQADPWAGNSAAVPETTSVVNGVSFQVTPNGKMNDVVATIPFGEGAAGKLFARLAATEN